MADQGAREENRQEKKRRRDLAKEKEDFLKKSDEPPKDNSIDTEKENEYKYNSFTARPFLPPIGNVEEEMDEDEVIESIAPPPRKRQKTEDQSKGFNLSDVAKGMGSTVFSLGLVIVVTLAKQYLSTMLIQQNQRTISTAPKTNNLPNIAPSPNPRLPPPRSEIPKITTPSPDFYH
jgi:hypothetical protein